MYPAPGNLEQPADKAWHHLSATDVLARLSSAAMGLSARESSQRLAAHGPNVLKAGKRIIPRHIFFEQFKSLIIWILIAAGVVSGVLGEVADAIALRHCAPQITVYVRVTAEHKLRIIRAWKAMTRWPR
jgi:Ca2+-transporting ATPase